MEAVGGRERERERESFLSAFLQFLPDDELCAILTGQRRKVRKGFKGREREREREGRRER